MIHNPREKNETNDLKLSIYIHYTFFLLQNLFLIHSDIEWHGHLQQNLL